jgi:superfamily II DNA helicase RecQ
MKYAANLLAALFVFLPVDHASAEDFKKSIFYFPSHHLAQHTCNLIRALAPEHLSKCFYAFTAIYSEEYKETVMEWFHQGQVQWLFCMDAAGMGCNIPDIVWAIVYGMQEMCTAFQKSGRAGQ